ncbi:MAG TPA: hypothetical protein VHD62_03815 [Opitutaceae bacterium]|nr:hypothetical protein [Opitutaceae bacterium]
MKHDPSRKHFFAQLLGFGAAFGVIPQLVAKVLPSRAVERGPAAEALPVQVQPERRAVARRSDSV